MKKHFSKQSTRFSVFLSTCLIFVLIGYGCTVKKETETSSLSPSPAPAPAPDPTPSPAPDPLPSGWVATPGNIPDGSWHDPAVAPDATHAGAYGGLGYAPNGDLFFFYETGTYPNENLINVIRRAASSTWSAEHSVGQRLRTAELYFDGANAYVAAESGGSVSIYKSTNFSNNAPSTVTWNSDAYFQAADSNSNGDGVYGPAYLVKEGSNFFLFHSYLYYSNVTGASLYGMNVVSQTGGAWPASGTVGAPLDNYNLVSIFSYPRAAAGAYSNGAGTFLAFSKIAVKSTDGGATFSQIMNTGSGADDLTGVLTSCKNPTDGSILIANYYSGNIAIWGTQDFSTTITKLTTFAGTPKRGSMACIDNLLVLAYTSGPTYENYINIVKSVDGGNTWSAPSTLIDVTNAGANPSYTVGSVNLAASASGDMTLGYSVVSGTTHLGAYIKEFY